MADEITPTPKPKTTDIKVVSVKVLGEFPLACPLSNQILPPGQIKEGVPLTGWLKAQAEIGLLQIIK
jgi:hypothetical protein